MLNSSNFLAYTDPAQQAGVLLSHYYQAQAEHQLVTTDLLQTALRVKARVVIFCADNSPAVYENYLSDLYPAPRFQQVKLISLRNWLPGLSSFTGENWLETIEAEYEFGKEAGFHKLYVLFEMGWLEKANIEPLDFINFQVKLARVAHQLRALILLQFQRDRLDPVFILPSLYHQFAFIYGTRTIHNPFYYRQAVAPISPQGNTALEHLLFQFDKIYKDQNLVRKSFENYQSLVDSIPILLANFDTHLHHIFVNQAYANFFGVRQEDLIGQPISRVFNQLVLDRLRGLIERGLSGETVDAELEMGHQKTIKIHLVPQLENDKTRSVIAIIEDISQLKETERRIHLLNSGLEAATTGIVITNREGLIEWANPALFAMTRYQPEELIGKHTRIFNSQKHDREFFEDLWTTVLSGNTWQGEVINRRKDGSLYYEDLTITPVRADGNGEITHFIAIKQDISDRKQAEEELQRSEERYRMLVENQGEGSIIFDEHLRFEYVNIAGENIFGVSMKGFSKKTLYDFLDEESKKIVHQEIRQRRKGRSSSYEVTLIRPDGKQRHVIITATPRFDAQGKFIGSFALFRDITERKEMEDNLRYYSAHDRLTDLYNRFFFDEEMKRLEKGRDFPVSIIVMDMDNLKIVNDTYGHLVGDALLKRLAGVLQDTFRGDDVISRIGGDEFAVILPRTKIIDLENSIARLRSKIEAANAAGKADEQIHISVGGATAEVKMPLVHALEQADLLMYDEKRRKKRQANSQ